MSSADHNTRYFDRILLEMSANNAPYLTAAGYGYLAIILVCGITSAFALVVDLQDWFAFLAASTATAVCIMAALYGFMLLSWRAFQTQMIRIKTSIQAQRLSPDDRFECHCQIDYPLFWPVCADAIRIDVPSYIKVLNNDDMSVTRPLSHKKNIDFCFRLKALGVGNAAIFGQAIAISDPLHLFRAEIHIENIIEIPILPPQPHPTHQSDELTSAVARYITPQMPHLFDISDSQKIRNWHSGDAMKHILWRGYAKRQELMVLANEPINQNSLLCLIDAGPHMRLVTTMQGFDNPLIAIVEKIARCADEFELITLIAYDEYHASVIAQNAPPSTAISKLESWLLNCLAYHNNYYADDDNSRLSLAATHVNQAFRLYKGVDFKKIDKHGAKIELLEMVQWARADMMAQLLKNNESQQAHAIHRLPYPLMLERLLQLWYREPMTMLPPGQPEPCFHEAIQYVVPFILNGSATLLMWFSDFALSLDDSAIQKLIQSIYQTHLPAIGIQMNMPLHSLNYIAAKGALCQQANCQKLSPVMEFVKSHP